MILDSAEPQFGQCCMSMSKTRLRVVGLVLGTGQPVGGVVAHERVVASSAEEFVGTAFALQVVVAIPSVEIVVAVQCGRQVLGVAGVA